MSISFKVLLTVDGFPLLEFAAVDKFGLDPLRKALASLDVSFPESSEPALREPESEDDTALEEEMSDDEVELLEVAEELSPSAEELETEFMIAGFSILRSLRTSTLIFSEMFFNLMILSIASFAVAAGLSDFNLRVLRTPRSP